MLAVGTPVLLFSYGQIRKAMRPALDCGSQSDCVDLRGLNELPFLFGLWIALSALAIFLSIYASKLGEKNSRIAIWVSSFSLALALLVVGIAIIAS